MKLSDIRPCDSCGGQIAPMFNVVRFSLAMFNPKAVNETLGLTQFFGGSSAALVIAEVMGASGEDAVKIAGDEDNRLWNEFFICQDCMMDRFFNLMLLMEKVSSKKEDSDVQSTN